MTSIEEHAARVIRVAGVTKMMLTSEGIVLVVVHVKEIV